MAGKGDMVTYERKTVTTKEERAKLKQAINRLLDTVTEKITIIALVSVPKPSGAAKSGAKRKGKKASRR